jgi:hypothetical protein
MGPPDGLLREQSLLGDETKHKQFHGIRHAYLDERAQNAATRRALDSSSPANTVAGRKKIQKSRTGSIIAALHGINTQIQCVFMIKRPCPVNP